MTAAKGAEACLTEPALRPLPMLAMLVGRSPKPEVVVVAAHTLPALHVEPMEQQYSPNEVKNRIDCVSEVVCFVGAFTNVIAKHEFFFSTSEKNERQGGSEGRRQKAEGRKEGRKAGIG